MEIVKCMHQECHDLGDDAEDAVIKIELVAVNGISEQYEAAAATAFCPKHRDAILSEVGGIVDMLLEKASSLDDLKNELRGNQARQTSYIF